MPSQSEEIGVTANGQQQQQQQYLQAGAISPGVTFSDDHYEQYDSDMEADVDLGPSLETLHEGQIIKSGYLHKKGERIKVNHNVYQRIDGAPSLSVLNKTTRPNLGTINDTTRKTEK
jgi:hypothetical protein